jgi:hypothetical protein
MSVSSSPVNDAARDYADWRIVWLGRGQGRRIIAPVGLGTPVPYALKLGALYTLLIFFSNAFAHDSISLSISLGQDNRVHSCRGTPVNALNPDRMTAAERLAEIAEILARGLMRLQARQSSQKSGHYGDSYLDFAPNQRSHVAEHELGDAD